MSRDPEKQVNGTQNKPDNLDSGGDNTSDEVVIDVSSQPIASPADRNIGTITSSLDPKITATSIAVNIFFKNRSDRQIFYVSCATKFINHLLMYMGVCAPTQPRTNILIGYLMMGTLTGVASTTANSIYTMFNHVFTEESYDNPRYIQPFDNSQIAAKFIIGAFGFTVGYCPELNKGFGILGMSSGLYLVETIRSFTYKRRHLTDSHRDEHACKQFLKSAWQAKAIIPRAIGESLFWGLMLDAALERQPKFRSFFLDNEFLIVGMSAIINAVVASAGYPLWGFLSNALAWFYPRRDDTKRAWHQLCPSLWGSGLPHSKKKSGYEKISDSSAKDDVNATTRSVRSHSF